MKGKAAAKWIYYPGDFEMALFLRVMTQRYERDVIVPPFWRMDGHYTTVVFTREFTLDNDDEITVTAQGEFNIQCNGYAYSYDFNGKLKLPKGKHALRFTVHNKESVLALLVQGGF